MMMIRNLLKRIYNFPGFKEHLLFFLLSLPFLYLVLKDIEKDEEEWKKRKEMDK